MVKKDTNSARERIEHTINIKEGEFDVLIGCAVQSHRKDRFIYPYGKHLCEIDFYLDRLNGYVRVEVEFKSDDDMQSFTPPAWFGREITEINHEIHKDLGLVTFDEMKDRYHQKGIVLEKITHPHQ